MSLKPSPLVIPRPGSSYQSTGSPLPGPSEEAFTGTFGALLPPAQFLHCRDHGKAAYYEIAPSSTAEMSNTVSRVLFIHGVQTPALSMLPLARALHGSFPHAHFVLLDLWGHGLSDTPLVPHEASLFHGLIDVLLDKLAWPSAHFVGFSFGGSLTAGHVATRPERVQSFVLVAPAGLRKSSDLPEEGKKCIQGGDEESAQKFVLEWLEGGALTVPEDWKERVQRGEVVAEAVRRWQVAEHPGHMASVVGIFRDGGIFDRHETFKKAAKSNVASLAVLGELDGVCKEEWLEQVGIANVAVVSQVGHGIVRERVPEVASLVDQFWKKMDIAPQKP